MAKKGAAKSDLRLLENAKNRADQRKPEIELPGRFKNYVPLWWPIFKLFAEAWIKAPKFPVGHPRAGEPRFAVVIGYDEMNKANGRDNFLNRSFVNRAEEEFLKRYKRPIKPYDLGYKVCTAGEAVDKMNSRLRRGRKQFEKAGVIFNCLQDYASEELNTAIADMEKTLRNQMREFKKNLRG